MAMSQDEGGNHLDRTWNCCYVTQAPLPEFQSHPPLPMVAPRIARGGVPALLVRPVSARPEKASIPSASPPDQQALHCVFLI